MTSASSSLPTLNVDWVDLKRPLPSLRARLESVAIDWYSRYFRKSLPRDCDSIVIGVPIPLIRDAVKEILAVDGEGFVNAALFPKRRSRNASAGKKTKEYVMSCEERMALSFLIGLVKVDFERRLEWIEAFVPYIDSWAVCDEFCASIKPKPSEKSEFWNYIGAHLASEEPYAIRFAIVMMLKLYVDKTHIDALIDRVEELARRRVEARAVKMGIAWLLAEAFIKCPDSALRYLDGGNSLDDETFNATIQKICDSKRVDAATKKDMKAKKRFKNKKR